MKILRYIIVTLLGLMTLTTLSAQNDVVKWNTWAENIDGESYNLTFRATITDGWHMYDMGPYEFGPSPTTFEFDLAGAVLSGRVVPTGSVVKEYDDLFEMNIGYYEKTVTFRQRVRLTAETATVKATVEWMACNDTSCLPPDDLDFVFELKREKTDAGEAVIVAGSDAASSGDSDNNPDGEGVVSELETALEDFPSPGEVFTGEYASSEEVLAAGTGKRGGSLWSIIIEAILWGFAALLTPCVFPMVPMTVSFFMKDGENSKAGKFKAAMYGFFIIALYTLPIAAIILVTWILGGDAVTADIFNWVATHWLPNIIFFLVFMVFAASFFGAFEITLPSRFVNKTDSKSDRGGLGGVFFMALTLVLVSFSCTGPIVSTVLIKSTSGEFWEPIVTMFAFSVAFALPFTMFAIFPTLLKKMPKSGGWLNSVKVVLGFVEVALGLKFLSVADQTYHWGLLDREVYLAIWIVVFSLMGLYLLGKIKFAHDSEVKHIGVGRLSLVIIVFSFVVYLIPGMWGAPLKALAGYMPPMHTQDFVIPTGSMVSSGPSANTVFINPQTGKVPKYSDYLHLPHNLQGFYDLKEASDYAESVNKPLFIDITGLSCVNCREMEERVWSDPRVLEMLRNDYVVVALFVDDKKTLPESEWVTTDKGRVLKTVGKINAHFALETYGTNAQPYYILQGRGGDVLVPPMAYDLNADNFVEFLRSGIQEYKKRY